MKRVVRVASLGQVLYHISCKAIGPPLACEPYRRLRPPFFCLAGMGGSPVIIMVLQSCISACRSREKAKSYDSRYDPLALTSIAYTLRKTQRVGL